MRRVFLTSDTHLFHDAIRLYCCRPFTNVTDMNRTIVSNWNRTVSDGDLVLHLGDVALAKASRSDEVRETLARLRGRKVLVPGNHDGKRTVRLCQSLGWNVYRSISVGGYLFTHRPVAHSEIDSWTLNVHGHKHGTMPACPGFLDVGVDVHGFMPVDAAAVLPGWVVAVLRGV